MCMKKHTPGHPCCGETTYDSPCSGNLPPLYDYDFPGSGDLPSVWNQNTAGGGASTLFDRDSGELRWQGDAGPSTSIVGEAYVNLNQPQTSSADFIFIETKIVEIQDMSTYSGGGATAVCRGGIRIVRTAGGVDLARFYRIRDENGNDDYEVFGLGAGSTTLSDTPADDDVIRIEISRTLLGPTSTATFEFFINGVSAHTDTGQFGVGNVCAHEFGYYCFGLASGGDEFENRFDDFDCGIGTAENPVP